MTRSAPETHHLDLLLKGGHVIDPLTGSTGGPTCASARGGWQAVAPDMPPTSAETVLDVAGYYVVPGIIDMHAHVFSTHRRSTLSLNPHVNTFSSGVTTVVDAGTAGWRDFADFRSEVIDCARIRVLAYINIVGSGMGGEWEHDVREMRPVLAAAMAMSTVTWWSGSRPRTTGQNVPLTPNTRHGPRSTPRSRPASVAECRSWSISIHGCPSAPIRI